MARLGAQTLLTKYNNPTSYSVRILINNKSYYHPYKIYLSSTIPFTLILLNTTKIGDVGFESYRCQRYFGFVHRTKNYNVTFNRHHYSIDIGIDVHMGILTGIFNIEMRKPALELKFTPSHYIPGIEALDSIVGNTITEIYRNHRCDIDTFMLNNMPYIEQQWKERYTEYTDYMNI